MPYSLFDFLRTAKDHIVLVDGKRPEVVLHTGIRSPTPGAESLCIVCTLVGAYQKHGHIFDVPGGERYAKQRTVCAGELRVGELAYVFGGADLRNTLKRL